MDSSQSDLDKIHDALNVLKCVQHDLASLASAYERLGLAAMTEEVYAHCSAIDKARLDILEATRSQINQRLRESEQATANMLALGLGLLKKDT